MSFTAEFEFDIRQVVKMTYSDEFGEVRARRDYAHGEPQYLVYYRSATGCATESWFGESQLDAFENSEHPGHEVYGITEKELRQNEVYEV